LRRFPPINRVDLLSARSSSFRSDIEGLRGLAVLAVVAFHCGIPGVSGGFIGVDVFFAVSGYLITGLLASEIEKEGRLDLARFYGRRVRRLLPASAVMGLVTLLFSVLLLSPGEVVEAAKAAAASSVYASNAFFSRAAADYFAADTASNPFLHTWSLAVEEQFYFFWPLLIGFGLQYARSRRVLTVLLSVVTVGSFALCVWSTLRNPVFAFYQIPARAWEFGVGGLGALAATRKLSPWVSSLLARVGLACLLTSLVRIPGDRGFPGWIALIPVLSTTAILVAGRGAELVLNSRLLQILGKYSYSWYLWHWPLLVTLIAINPEVSILGKVTAASAALAFAWASYRWIENPFRFHPSLVRSVSRSLVLGVVLMAVSAGAALATLRYGSWLSSRPEMSSVREAQAAYAGLPRELCIATGDGGEVKSCDLGNTSSSMRIVLFGDSHAFEWLRVAEEIAGDRGMRLTVLTKSGCPAAEIRRPGKSRQFEEGCNQWRREALAQIQLLRPHSVVVASYAGYLGRTKGSETDGGPVPISLDEWQAGTRRTLLSLAASGARVVHLRDNPRPSFDVPACVARSIRRPWLTHCSMRRADVVDEAAYAAQKAAAEGITNISFADFTGQYCGADLCEGSKDGELIYSDSTHPSPRFIQRLRPLLESILFP
jgi:peptidoglycan/LPS O-acetylase OafA/YrhL